MLIFKDISAKGFWMTRWYNKGSLEKRIEMVEEIFDLHRAGKFREPTINKHIWKHDDSEQVLYEALTRALQDATGSYSKGKQMIEIE